MNEKGCNIKIDDKEYRMVFTVQAQAAVEERYESVGNMLDVISKKKSTGDYVWIAELLINQGIMIHNYESGENAPLLRPGYVGFMMKPYEFKKYIGSITDAIILGIKGEVQLKDDGAGKDVVLAELDAEKNAKGAV